MHIIYIYIHIYIYIYVYIYIHIYKRITQGEGRFLEDTLLKRRKVQGNTHVFKTSPYLPVNSSNLTEDFLHLLGTLFNRCYLDARLYQSSCEAQRFFNLPTPTHQSSVMQSIYDKLRINENLTTDISPHTLAK